MWSYNQQDWCPCKNRRLQGETQKETHMQTTGRVWPSASQGQRTHEMRSAVTLISDLQPPELWKIQCLLIKLPSL
jgi:hypothetical protein